MALSKGKINPLNVLGFRLLSKIPKHFHTINVGINCDISSLTRWIYNNLNSRFAVIQEPIVTEQNHIAESIKIGFEDARETTLFMLTCPYLDDNNRRIK